jgi:hypothetical protein
MGEGLFSDLERGGGMLSERLTLQKRRVVTGLLRKHVNFI